MKPTLGMLYILYELLKRILIKIPVHVYVKAQILSYPHGFSQLVYLLIG